MCGKQTALASARTSTAIFFWWQLQVVFALFENRKTLDNEKIRHARGNVIDLVRVIAA